MLSVLKKKKFYNYGKGVLPSLGGTTTFVYNENSGKIEKQFMSLAGTIRNSVGRVTPWNSWITCEETTVRSGAY
jgi:secreted PhoX family phosphatase